MAIQPNKPSSRVFLIVGVALAALAFAGVLFALNQQKGGGNTASVVVAKKDIAPGTAVTSDLVSVTSVPTDATPADAFQSTTQVVGKTSAAAIKANTVLVPALFAQLGSPAAGGATTAGAPTVTSVEFTLRKGDVALAIPAQGTLPPCGVGTGLSGDLFAAGFYVLPGDHIDILVDNGSGTVRFAFQDLPVIRVGSVGATATPGIFIVEVARSQAELLTSLVQQKQVTPPPNPCKAPPFTVKYVLRPQTEWGKVSADGTTFTPNYLPSSGGQLPAAADPGVTPQSLDSIFGK